MKRLRATLLRARHQPCPGLYQALACQLSAAGVGRGHRLQGHQQRTNLYLVRQRLGGHTVQHTLCQRLLIEEDGKNAEF